MKSSTRIRYKLALVGRGLIIPKMPDLPPIDATTIDAAVKRVLDLVLAFCGLIFLSPLLVLIASAIYLDSGMPLIFRQIRLGQGGRHFYIYKFRKFRQKDGNVGLAVTLGNDSRLTRVGRVLMRTKLDELPQLWNVLRADMSMVGPRPEVLDFADCFKDEYRKVLDVKPGIFGPNQVFFRNESVLFEQSRDPCRLYREVLFPLKARVDIAYFSDRNVFRDIVWVLRGVLAVFGWLLFRCKGSNWADEVENWIRQHDQQHPVPLVSGDAIVPVVSLDSLPVVGVQGLGFVGAAMALAVASARDAKGRPLYNVIGVDLPTKSGLSRIEALNRGLFPFATSDETLTEKAQQACIAGNLRASSDAADFGSAAVIIVDVPFDVVWAEAGPALDLEAFRAAVSSIGRYMRPDVLVLIETTVPPGATAHVAAPILKEELAKRNLSTQEFMLAHSYERVMPGAKYFDSIVNMPRVYAGYDARSADACEAFLRNIINTSDHPLTRVSNTTASELAKVLENTYRAVTIALMDEWASFAEAINVDLFEIAASIRARPSHNNIRTPGFGVGGYCLTKDPLMGKLAAREIFNLDHPFPFSLMAVDTNRQMPKKAIERVKGLFRVGLKGKRVLLLGLTYREDVGDTRHSPSEIFYQAAKECGAEVLVHDPIIDYWSEQDIHIPRDIPPASGLDAVVLAVPHREYKTFNYEGWLDGCRPVFLDGFNILSAHQRNTLRALGCRIESIGRGSCG
jgi:UDP-N-acetyl-D-glucosamine dehydrogenase